MNERHVMASTFKQKCLALIDQVAVDRVPLVITKHGRPVAKLVPLDDPGPVRSTDGSVTLVADDDEEYFSTGASWEGD
jgi:prevent-host-death family protein